MRTLQTDFDRGEAFAGSPAYFTLPAVARTRIGQAERFVVAHGLHVLSQVDRRGELMRHVTAGYLFTLILSSVVFAAQDAKISTTTKVKSDNGKVVTMTGCVQIGGGTSFVLTNVTAEHEQHDKQTSRSGEPYALIAREGLDLGPYIDHKVELTGVVVPAATHGDKDDKIKIKETTKADVEHGPDKKSSAAVTVKVPRGAATQFLVASVKTLAPSCQE